MLHGNIDREEVKTLCDELNFNDIKVLVTQLKKRFPKLTPWSKRGENSKTREWLKTFSDVITLLSGGEESNLLTRFLSSRPTLKKVLDQSWQAKENQQKLEQLKGNYQQVIQQYCRNNELSDVQKDN